jgi:penicillin-binding protein 1B
MMTWPDFQQRSVAVIGQLRQRMRPRVVLRVIGLMAAAGTAVVVAEALVRARLGPIEARVPTALVTRPAGWDGGRAAPVTLAVVAGAPRERREPIPLDELPTHLTEAVLAVEDQRFTTHHGLDLRRIGGAMAANVKAGGIAQGGSTITQQLAKNLFLHAGRTPLRKFREAAMALTLEARHEKDQILEAYLNEIYLGQDGGQAIHGVGAAARFHLGKDARELSLAESAMLAAMIRSPNRLVPSRHPVDARARRDLVLDLMASQERATAAAVARAKRTRLPTRTHPARVLDARHFRDVVQADLPRGIPSRGAVVHTTLDAPLQRAAERAVRAGLARDELGGAEAALVALDPRTGEVLALVGGRDYGRSQFNRATEARRQPGSAFKPVVAAAALAPRGNKAPAYTLASVVPDEPLRVGTGQATWEPVNYDRTFRGEVSFREAMEQSLNVPFARIGMEVGPKEVATMGRRLGITSPLHPVPSLALGSSEVTLLELVRAYGVLAAGGELAATRTLIGQEARGAATVRTTRLTTEQVLDPRVAYLVTSALQGAVSSGTGRALSARGSIAGKTGTSNDWRDAWFVAYTPSLVVGVWVGHDDGRSLQRTGATAALPIVRQFLAAGAPQAGREEFAMPEGIVEAATTSGGGWFATCGRPELFLEGTEPATQGCIDFQYADWVDDRMIERFERRIEREGERELRRLEAMLAREARALVRRLTERQDR